MDWKENFAKKSRDYVPIGWTFLQLDRLTLTNNVQCLVNMIFTFNLINRIDAIAMTFRLRSNFHLTPPFFLLSKHMRYFPIIY